jgi:hypothetical protein
MDNITLIKICVLIPIFCKIQTKMKYTLR